MTALGRFQSARNNGAAPAPTPGRGRFAGVKAADNRFPLIPVGEFRLKVLETYVTRNPKSGEWYHADFEVLESTAQGFATGSKVSWLQGISGKSESVGLPKIKRFAMACAGTEKEEEYDAQDPQGDYIDASCGVAVEGLEPNPFAGSVVDCSCTPGKPRPDGRTFPEVAFMPVAETAQG